MEIFGIVAGAVLVFIALKLIVEIYRASMH